MTNGHDDGQTEAEIQLERKIAQHAAAVKHCLHENLWEPALTLIYAGIDAMAWLSRPANVADVRSEDFEKWVETYMLPDSNLPCSSADLYAARCGILHSMTGESRRHRNLQARKVFYQRRFDDETLALIQIRMNEAIFPAMVDVDQLAWAFGQAVNRFVDEINADATLHQLVSERIDQSYLTEVRRLR